MKHPLCTVLLFSTVLTACGKDSNEEPELGATSVDTLDLPTSPSEKVLLKGKMTYWDWEGDAGCYGTFEKDGQEVQLWANADACENVEYKENQQVSIKVTFNPDEQWGPGNTYTVTNF